MSSLDDIYLERYAVKNEYLKDGLFFNMVFKKGLLKRSVTQIVAESNVNKTELLLQSVSNFCKNGYKVLYIDTKNNISEYVKEKLKLVEFDGTLFYHVRVSDFNSIREILLEYIPTEKFDLVVLDSLPHLVNSEFLDLGKKDIINTNNTNINTKPLINLLKILNNLVNEYNFGLVLLNEYKNTIDSKIGTILKPFGPKILDNLSNNIIQIKKNSIKDNDLLNGIYDKTDGIKLNINITKSNESLNFKGNIIYLNKDNQIDLVAFKLTTLEENNEIEKKGTYYKINKLGINANGKVNLYNDLKKVLERKK